MPVATCLVLGGTPRIIKMSGMDETVFFNVNASFLCKEYQDDVLGMLGLCLWSAMREGNCMYVRLVARSVENVTVNKGASQTAV